jgi:hypothetical protein
VGPDLGTAVFYLFEGTLHTWAKMACDLVHKLIWVLQKITAPGTIPVFLDIGCEIIADELAAIATLMHTNLAKSTNHYLVVIEVIKVETNIAGDLIFVRVLFNYNMLQIF